MSVFGFFRCIAAFGILAVAFSASIDTAPDVGPLVERAPPRVDLKQRGADPHRHRMALAFA